MFLHFVYNSLRDSLYLYFPSNNDSKNDVTIPKILLILEDHELERYTDM